MPTTLVRRFVTSSLVVAASLALGVSTSSEAWGRVATDVDSRQSSEWSKTTPTALKSSEWSKTTPTARKSSEWSKTTLVGKKSSEWSKTTPTTLRSSEWS